MNRIETVGVIGSGIAGLACARTLSAAGLQVQLFDKSRSVGGRVATRRADSGVAFDHGAQFFTVHEAPFREQVTQWCAAGVAALWQGRIVALDRGAAIGIERPFDRFVGVPAMTSIAKSLAEGLQVHKNVTVHSVRRSEGRWYVEDAASGGHGSFDFLVCAAPAPQTAAILSPVSAKFSQRCAVATMAPCWCVMAHFPDPLATSFDAAFVRDSSLSWIARNSSKPGRAKAECWVLHATAPWSTEYLEDSPTTVADLLVQEFWQVTGCVPQSPSFVVSHRWRYSLPQEHLPSQCVVDRDLRLGACGDWCGGPRVEGAYMSGLAMANEILKQSHHDV